MSSALLNSAGEMRTVPSRTVTSMLADWNVARTLVTLVHQNEIFADLQRDRLVEIANTDARPLEIAKNRDWLAGFVGEASDQRNRRRVLIVRTVRKVDASDVHSGFDQSANRILARGRRPQCTDDFCAGRVDACHFPPGAKEPIFVSSPEMSSSKDF